MNVQKFLRIKNGLIHGTFWVSVFQNILYTTLLGFKVAIAQIFLTLFFTVQVTAEPPFKLPSMEDLSRLKLAKIVTSKGEMYFELFPEEAPYHVANFKYLADKKFYRSLNFSQFYENYLIQGGEPKGGKSGPGYSIQPEFSSRNHKRGTLGMARRGDILNKERKSNGSQFHILLSDAKHMDGLYTIFGEMIEGDDVLSSLSKGDKIQDVFVYVRDW